MTRTLTLTTAALLGLAHGTAQACSCMPPSISGSFDAATDVAVMRIEGSKLRGDTLYYSAQILRPFKGCTVPGEKVILATSASSATCGETDLQTRQTILIFGEEDGAWGDITILDINLCDYNTPVGKLTPDDKRFLGNNAEVCNEECEELKPGSFGACDMLLGWGVSTLSGLCEPFSGCDAPDSGLFPSWAQCADTCERD